MLPSLLLEPALSDRLERFLAQPELLFEMVRAFGAPVNLVFPQRIAENVKAFQQIYDEHHLRGRILYAHKTNRSSALLRELAITSAGVDVASLRELQHALVSGFAPDRIIAGGPKNPEFLWLAACAGIPVNIDSRRELDVLTTMVRAFQIPPVTVTIRLSGFESSGVRIRSKASRFGVPVSQIDAVLDVLEQYRDAVRFDGMGFHLDTVSIPEKVVALTECLRITDRARQRGFDPRGIDIGGGFKANYLKHQSQWEDYTTALHQAVLGKRKPLSWNGQGFGLRNDGGVLAGELNAYSWFDSLTGPAYLDRLLSEEAPGFSRPLGTLLLENMYELDIEPGRALVDQCGLTVTRVLDEWTVGGNQLVRLDMNRDDVTMLDNEVFVDPVILPRRERRDGNTEPVGVYFVGNICLESDFISRRQVFCDQLPEPGDLVAFANTAGYLMDFSANHALQQRIARKIAVVEGDDGAWRWWLDEEYWPFSGRVT